MKLLYLSFLSCNKTVMVLWFGLFRWFNIFTNDMNMILKMFNCWDFQKLEHKIFYTQKKHTALHLKINKHFITFIFGELQLTPQICSKDMNGLLYYVVNATSSNRNRTVVPVLPNLPMKVYFKWKGTETGKKHKHIIWSVGLRLDLWKDSCILPHCRISYYFC